MNNITFFSGKTIPLEMHKARIVQKLEFPFVARRMEALTKAGNNTFLLTNKDIFLDMLTDSGVNAMSDNQLGAMMQADDSYAGSATFTRLNDTIADLFGTAYFLPVHQGRAAEHILAQTYVKPGNIIPMNYHFTTSKAHICKMGGSVAELVIKEGLNANSNCPFKGDFDIDKLKELIKKEGAGNIPFIRLEAGTNLIGGQPFSLSNATMVCKIARDNGILTVLDASLLQDNLYFIKTREEEAKGKTIREITKTLASMVDIIYFSARKLGFARGGGICVHKKTHYDKMKEYITLYEGFLTYGGMSVREMEAIAIGLNETMDEDIISQGPMFIAYMCEKLIKNGLPVVTPPGGLGCHINAREFLPGVPQSKYPAGALTAAIYLASGIRGMERGTMSEQRRDDGSEVFSDMELVRLALPRRVFTLSQVEYAIDRLTWLYNNKDIIDGLKFVEEPSTLRFFFGRLMPVNDWQEKLCSLFIDEFGKEQ